MILFTQRKEIENKYREWINRYDLEDSAFNVIAFLSGSGLLVETMDAAEFLMEFERMCDSYVSVCSGCPLFNAFPFRNCNDIIKQQPIKVIGMVKQWAEEHKE